jgi:hypothetical protein
MKDFTLNFMVPGFGKSGTTTLCHMLAQHDGICFSNPKEPNFFTSDVDDRNWDDYKEGFSHGINGQIFGEASTRYTSPVYEERVASELYRLYPDLKLVFVVREPIARIESSFREMHFRGPEYGFDAPFLIQDAIGLLPMMKQGSMYWQRLKPYLDRFPAKHIHIVFFEDYISYPQKTLDALFCFLGLKPLRFSTEKFVKLNSEQSKLQDTLLLRKLRNTLYIGPLLSKMHRDTQDLIFSKLSLRRKFTSDIKWDDSYKASLIDELSQDVRQLLAYVNRSDSVWGCQWVE